MSLCFGMGRESINPPMKMGLAGYFNTRIWTTVLDPIEVRCAVIKDQCSTAVTVQFELITVTAELQTAIRKVCDKHLDDYTLLATATHCHTAPELRIGRGGYDANYVPFAAEAFEKALGGNEKKFLCVEMSTGQMIEDVKLAVGDKAEVHFFGRTGGIVPTPKEILNKIVELGGAK